MADPRFYSVAGPFTLETLAEMSGARIGGEVDPGTTFTDVASLDVAGPTDIAFLDNRRYADDFAKSAAGACLVHPDLAAKAPSSMALLLFARAISSAVLPCCRCVHVVHTLKTLAAGFPCNVTYTQGTYIVSGT